MRLNPDCIRAILLTVEEYTGFKKLMNVDEKHYAQYPLLQEFEFDEIAYHIVQCNLSGYFLDFAHQYGDRFMIVGLSPNGHEFVENVRISSHWNEIKKIADSTGSKSLKVVSQLADLYWSKKICNQNNDD